MSVFEAAQKNIKEFYIFLPVNGLFFPPFYTRADRHTKYKKSWCARGWCVRRGSLLQDRLPVKFQGEIYSSEVPASNFHKNRHEAFILYIICLQSIFSVVEINLFAKN